MIVYLPLIAAFIMGITLFYLMFRYGTALANLYNVRVVGTVDAQLKKSFIQITPARLISLTVLVTLVLAALGLMFTGPVGLLAGILIGLSSPWVYQRVVRKRRTRQFVYQLPDALSSLAASMRGGGSLSKGLEQLAIRQPPPLSQEFALLVAENRVGRDLEESLQDMTARLNCKELELLTVSITIARNVGGNLADTLEILADTLREKAQVEGKIEALTATGRAQGWVISLLPLGVGIALYLQKPESMSVLFTEVWGWGVLAVIAVMMSLAVWMIYKIVNIDV